MTSVNVLFANCANTTWGVVKTRPVSLVLAGALAAQDFNMASSTSYSDYKNKPNDAAETARLFGYQFGLLWGATLVDDYANLFRNPMSSSLLAVGVIRAASAMTQNAIDSEYPLLCPENLHWEDLALFLTALGVRFGGPKLPLPRYVAWAIR